MRKSPRGNKVGQNTGKVRKSTSARTRRSLNGKSTGKRIATKPAPKVDVASNDVDSNDEATQLAYAHVGTLAAFFEDVAPALKSQLQIHKQIARIISLEKR